MTAYTGKVSNKEGNKFNKNIVNNFSGLPNSKFRKYVLNSEFIFRSEKKEKNKIIVKSSRGSKNHSKSKKNKIKNFSINKTYETNIKINNIKPNTSYIIEKMAFQQKYKKKIKTFKIIRNIYYKEKNFTNPNNNHNDPELSCRTSFNQNKIKKQNICTINLNNNKIKKRLNKGKQIRYIKYIYFPNKIESSLDNILSKAKINKTKTKIKSNSYEKNDKIFINQSPKIRLNLMEIKLFYEKSKNNKKYSGDKKHKKNIKNKVQNKNSKSKGKDKYNKDGIKYGNSKIEKKIQSNNNSIYNTPKNYESTNFKNKLISKNLNTTINKKKKERYFNIISVASKKRDLNDNNFNNVFECTTENEKNERINGIKINNYGVNKPKEENLKFTIAKDDKESDLNISQASKVIIGKIDGYQDIIETDKKNNYNNYYSDIIFKKNNNLNLYNNIYLNNNLKKLGKQINNFDNNQKNNISDYSNDSYFLKAVENDEFSFTINTNNNNNNKKSNYNKIHINRKEDKKNGKNSDNCYIY